MRALRQMIGTLMVAAAAGALGLAGCASKPVETTVAFVPSSDLSAAGLKQIWSRPVLLGPGERVSNVWRVNDSVYVTTNQATVIRINAATGEKSWEVSLPQMHETIFRPVETPDKSMVLVVNRGNAFLYNKGSGGLVSSSALSISVLTDPYIAGNVLCLGGVDDFYGIYLDTLGGQKWVTNAPNDMFVTPPVPVGDKIILTSREGHLWRISPETGDWDWKDHKTNGLVTGAPAAGEKGIFAPAQDKRVYAFDVKNGGQLWDTRLEGMLNRPITVTRTKVLVPTTGAGLYALSQDKGDILWHLDGSNEVGTVTPGKVWVMDGGGNLKSVDLETGAVIASAQVAAPFSIVRNSVDQTIIVANQAGVVAAYMAK